MKRIDFSAASAILKLRGHLGGDCVGSSYESKMPKSFARPIIVVGKTACQKHTTCTACTNLGPQHDVLANVKALELFEALLLNGRPYDKKLD
jgi:hypothetical protein